ncbi:MAG: hypothetical protein ACE5MG_05625 [Candidatus Methylomirabilales bacterium]
MIDQLKNKRTLILLGLTIAAAAFLASDFFLSSPKARHASRKASDPPAVARAMEKAKAAQQKVAAASKATGGRDLAPPPAPDQPWGRDPFVIGKNQLSQGPKPVVKFSGFRLTGIVWGPRGYQALVNDYVVRVGDQVNGARVVSITKEGVELAKDGQTYFLPLIPRGRFQ